MNILELQKKVIEFRDARVTEVSMEQGAKSRERRARSEEHGAKSTEQGARRKDEIDILIYALNLCHAFGFDPSEVILEKLAINERKYPVEKAKGSAEKYTKY
jgi:hypothetical protein